MTEKQENGTMQLDIMNPVKLISVADNIQGNMMEALLNSAEIKVYRRTLESGGAMQAYMGYSIYGEDLYVDKADYEQALEIIELMENASDEDLDAEFDIDQLAETDKDDIDRADINNEKSRWLLFIAIFLIMFALLGISERLPTLIGFWW